MSDEVLENEVSARRRARLEAGAESAEARAAIEQQLAYAARDFVLCGFPLRRPKDGAGAVYRRHNGDAALEMIAGPQGMPYGQDRLIPIWLATAFFAAGKPPDNTIRFRCAADILRAFGKHTDGIYVKRLREGLLRVFKASYVVTYKPAEKDGAGIDETRFALMRSLRINLLAAKRCNVNQYTLWQDRIVLDPHFADQLREGGRVPIDLQSVIALKECSAALDLYIWQAWRSFRLQRDGLPATSIPIFGEQGLMAQLGSAATTPRKIKDMLRGWQREVAKVWQGCPNYLDRDCQRFYLHPGNAIATAQKIPILPGVSLTPPPVREIATGGELVLVREDAPPG